MSNKQFSRAFQEGKIKKLRRMRQPLLLRASIELTPRNPVAKALAERSVSSAAGKHIRSRGAQRRADKTALQRAIRQNRLADL